jgi:hypothetical protein
MADITFGKAKMNIIISGCVDCGTEHSWGWYEARVVNIQVDSRKPMLRSVYRCGDCNKKKPSLFDKGVGL